MLEGHKNIMALKSPVFKAMLYGPLRETGDLIKIRNTSMFAFKTMLEYIHDDLRERWPWETDIKEVIHIADLAERYHLPGLKEWTIDSAYALQFPKDKLIEIASLAEQFHVFTDLSKALLFNCAEFFSTTVETPDDFNDFVKKWSRRSTEEMGVAFRLLARVDHYDMVYVDGSYDTQEKQEVYSHLRNINKSINPRHRLQKLKAMIDDSEGDSREDMLHLIDKSESKKSYIVRSLGFCLKKDAEKAALEGIPLRLDTLVEDRFTHEMSVMLHLDVISLATEGYQLDLSTIDFIWENQMLSDHVIPEVQSIILAWFSDNSQMVSQIGHLKLAEYLDRNEDELKQLEEYQRACSVYPSTGY